jgi:hypothetical protein
MLTGATAKIALMALVFLVAAFLGLRNYQGGHLADEIMKETDESDEELLERLIRREAAVAAKRLGVSQTEAEGAIRQQWEEGRLQIRQGVLRQR